MHARRAVIKLGIIALGIAAADAALSRTPYSFDDATYLGDAALMPDWSATLERQRRQSAALEACRAAPDQCARLYKGVAALLDKAAALPRERQIRLVNYYVNRKRYRDDRTRVLDTPLVQEPVKYRSRWSTVQEFLERGGDCEDYATTKYFLLRALGFEAERLRIVVTWDRDARGYHALLAVKNDDGRITLLDSDDRIRIAGRRHGYRFIYSVNENSVWDHEENPRRSRTVSANMEKSA